MKLGLAAGLVAATAAVVVLVTAPAVTAQCSSTVVRKEFRQMSNDEKQRYFDAVKLLNTGNRPNQMDRFSQVHVYYAGEIHGAAPFLPFHRQFVRDWEQVLQRVSGDTSIYQPYWDWTVDSQDPKSSPIFTDDWLGGNGNDGCVRIPKLAGDGNSNSNWTILFNGDYKYDQRCLKRDFDQSQMSAYYSKSSVETMMGEADNFGQFSHLLESTPHGVVHVSIGGDMNTMASPNDPLFFFHHANLDKLWDDWVRKNPTARDWDYSGLNRNGATASYRDLLPYYGNPVWTVMPLGNMCYTYDISAHKKRNVNATAPAPPAPPPPPSQSQPQPQMPDMSANSSTRGPPPPPPVRSGNADYDKNKNNTIVPIGGALTIGQPGAVPLGSQPVGNVKCTAFESTFLKALLDDNPLEKFLPKLTQPLKQIPELPESFIKMNRLNVTIVRAWERRLVIHINNVNKNNGFLDSVVTNLPGGNEIIQLKNALLGYGSGLVGGILGPLLKS
ncbi:Di-copper centre-containing protein [Ramicandelaber brevisporus]|nr:Di-copper centre-containing protein [Ramicandelaber brevisporus]